MKKKQDKEKQKIYARYKKGTVVKVIEHYHNSVKTSSYTGLTGVTLETSICPCVEIGNEKIVFSEDELMKIRD